MKKMCENQIAGFVRFYNSRKERNKIKMKRITFDYGECDGIDPYPITFTSWREANGWIIAMSPGNVVYYKTWFTIEYEDGKTFEGRYDIQGKLSDRPEIADLGAHVRRSFMEGAKNALTKSEQDFCKELLAHYEIKYFTL